jgi:hypothetical protein
LAAYYVTDRSRTGVLNRDFFISVGGGDRRLSVYRPTAPSYHDNVEEHLFKRKPSSESCIKAGTEMTHTATKHPGSTRLNPITGKTVHGCFDKAESAYQDNQPAHSLRLSGFHNASAAFGLYAALFQM